MVILSIVALKAFLSWLALRPRNTRVTQQISLTMADGTVVTKTLDVESSAPGDANPELVRELLSMEGLTAEVRAALTSALSDG